MLATQLESYKNRRCSTCTVKDKDKFGCEKDIKPFPFDGEKLTRCPLRPFKENPSQYAEYFQLYAFKEKNIPAEPGGFYDQPNLYVEVMAEMDSAVSDGLYPKKHTPTQEDQDKLSALSRFTSNIVEKK